jgi:5'-deoxynucleotidase YfbR-like HD superfamily hydrolase
MAQSLSKLYIHLIFHIKNGSAEINKTKRYIENQEIHHKKKTFREEYLSFLKKYEINYNEQFLWTD